MTRTPPARTLRLPCGHDGTDAVCSQCRVFRTDDGYNRAWGGRGVRRLPPPPSPCVHLGEEVRRVGCGSCRGKVELKVFRCAVHGECTLGKRAPEVKGCCESPKCPDRKTADGAYGGPVVRNLVYHVAPVSGNGVWQKNVAQLLRRIDLFNGRRVVAVVAGRAKRLDYKAEFDLDPPRMVREAFAGHVREFIELPNDPNLREVATFLPLMERVATAGRPEITFYAHAKGVTRPVNSGVTVHRWTEILYETCLDYPGMVEAQLAHRPVAGSFKKVGRMFDGSASAFHYSGGFYWLRNSLAFTRDWRRVDRRWWGSEAWPGLHFRPEEAGCLFHMGGVEMDVFKMDYLRRTVEPAYERWRADHADRRKAPC